jgi:hypothetical protein
MFQQEPSPRSIDEISPRAYAKILYIDITIICVQMLPLDLPQIWLSADTSGRVDGFEIVNFPI